MSKGWDNIALKKLKALTGKGLSTSEIGKRLGMSKNAIVGKLNRLGWNAKAGGATVAKKQDKSADVATDVKKTTKKAVVDKKDAAPKTKKFVTEKAEKVAEKKAEEKKSATVAKATQKEKKEPAKKTEEKKSIEKSSVKNLAMHQRIIQHSLEMAGLKPNQCRWPIGDPDSEHFCFCGETVFVGKPYCYEHCKQAYQFAPPKKK